MSKLRKIKAPIPLLCYGVCLIGFLAMCLWHFAGDSLARANGRLAEAQMTAADFVLAGLEQQADGTLVNALLASLDHLSGVGGVLRPGIVHRIDKDTSGLLVVAKNDKAHVSLSAQIADKTCSRKYYALLEGCVKAEKGRIATDIGRSPADRLKMAVLPAGRGKNAITDYEVAARYGSDYTLCRFMLHTGRTHQIRVHAKYMGHPVVGDPVYGYKKQKFSLNGQLLHAYSLSFTHPTTGERLTFYAPLPPYFSGLLEKLDKIYGVNLNVAALTGGGNAQDE